MRLWFRVLFLSCVVTVILVGSLGAEQTTPVGRWVNVDANTASPEFFRGRDDKTTIPTAKVVNNIIFGHTRLVEHLFYNILRRRLIENVGVMWLSTAGRQKTQNAYK